MRRWLVGFMIGILSWAAHAADDYPSRPIRMIVPFSAGGNSDLVARLLSQQLSEQMGVSFVVENRTGAAGTIGSAAVARSAPDGYTLLLVESSFPNIPSLFKEPSFDVNKDFTPIIQIMRMPSVLVVPAQLNVTSLKDFMALAKKNRGKFNYGSAGTGSSIHLTEALFDSTTGLGMTHVPYKGASDVINALVAGEVQLLISATSTAEPYIATNRIRALAITAEAGKRVPTMPTVAPLVELGVDMVTYGWVGLIGPAGMPKEIVDRLNAEVRKALVVPTIKARLVEMGGEIVGGTPGAFADVIRKDTQRWAPLIKSIGIEPQ